MTITLPFTVGIRTFAAEVEDEHGNVGRSWSDPVPTPAVYWSPSSSEPQIAGHDRVIVDLVLVVDSQTPIGPQDRVVVAGDEFEVAGHPEDYDHGPWWSPGRKPVNLRRVEG